MARREYLGFGNSGLIDDKFRFETATSNTLYIKLEVSSSTLGGTMQAAIQSGHTLLFNYKITHIDNTSNTGSVTVNYDNYGGTVGIFTIASISLNTGDTIHIIGNNVNGSTGKLFVGTKTVNGNTVYLGLRFDASNNIYCRGEIMYLLSENWRKTNTQTSMNQFVALFKNFTKLLTAPEMNMKRISMGDCSYMFYGCSGLTDGPTMDVGSSLNTMSAMTYMFYNCSSLQSIKLFTTNTTWPSGIFSATNNWVYGVNTNGRFYKLSTLADTRGSAAIPTNWTIVNMDE